MGKGVSKELIKEIFKTQTRDARNNASLAERIAATKAAVKRYSEEEKKEIWRKGKERVAKNKAEKEESDRAAHQEKLEAESKAPIAKQKREEAKARQDRQNYQGLPIHVFPG